MIVNIKRRDMLALAKKAARVAPANIAGEELKGILLEADDRAGVICMTATNLECAIRCVMPAGVEAGGQAVIKAGLLLQMLELLPEDDVYMELGKNSILYIRSDKAGFQLSVLPAEQYPKVDIPMPGSGVSVSGLKSLIAGARIAVPKVKSESPALNCIELTFSPEGLRASSGSAQGIIQVRGDQASVGAISLLIPASSLRLFAALIQDSDVFEVGVTGDGPTGKHMVFHDGAMTFAARLMDGRHLNMEQVFSDFVPATTVVAGAAALFAALDKVSVVAGPADAVELRLEANGLGLKCDTDKGVSEDKIPAAIENPPAKAIHLNVHRLMDCVAALKDDIILHFSQEGHLVILTDTVRYMQPAMQPVAKKKSKQPAKKEKAA